MPIVDALLIGAFDADQAGAPLLSENEQIARSCATWSVSIIALRDQVDLDSMDWLNFLVGLHQRLRVEIPEADYRKLTTLDTLVAYLAQKRV